MGAVLFMTTKTETLSVLPSPTIPLPHMAIMDNSHMIELLVSFVTICEHLMAFTESILLFCLFSINVFI
jgi:hypothetical protein